MIPRIDNCRYKRLLTSREASMSSIAERQILRHTSSGCLYIVQGIKCCSNFSLFHPWAPLLCARLVNMSDFSPWKMVFYPVNLGYLFYVKCSNCNFLAETFGSILRNVDCPPNGTGDRLRPAPSPLWRWWFIQLVGIRDPRIHRCVALSIAMLILDFLKFEVSE